MTKSVRVNEWTLERLRMARPQRLFDLLSVLRAQGKTTVAELAGALDVSERTIHRDLAVLTEVGVPIVTEPGRYGGVTILPGGRFTVSGLSSREKDLLHAIGLDVERAAQLGQEAVVMAAVGKLAPAPGNGGRPLTLPLSQVVMIDNRPWFSQPETTGDISKLADAVRTGNRLRIHYRRSGEAGAETRIVDPYGLLGRSGRWYLIADREGQPRQYATERLVGWDVLDEPRRLRPGTGLKDITASLAETLESPDEPVLVTATLDPGSIDLARRILGSRMVSEETVNGDVRLTIRYRQIDDVRQLLQFGEHITVTSPDGARCLMARLGATIAAQHGNS